MKQITLIIPDEINHVVGSSRSARSVPVDVTPENIIKVLCARDDYHEYYCIEPSDKVQVVSIVDYED